MKPRAAILLAGRIKGWQLCVKDFENAFSNYDYDIYCSLNCTEEDEDFLEFSKYKNVKKIQATLTDSYVDYSSYYMTKDHPAARSVSMFLHNKLAFDLIEEEYDVYIKARNDFHCSDINLEKNENSRIPIISKEELNKLWTPDTWQYGNHKFLINDQFAASNYENMKKYCYLIDHLKELIDSFPEHGKKFPEEYTNETALAMYVDKLNMKISKFKFNYFLSATRHPDADGETKMWTFLAQMINTHGLNVE
jgi:hypothetical protein